MCYILFTVHRFVILPLMFHTQYAMVITNRTMLKRLLFNTWIAQAKWINVYQSHTCYPINGNNNNKTREICLFYSSLLNVQLSGPRREIFVEYRPYLECDEETFLRECKRWMAKWTESSPAQYPDRVIARWVATEASYPTIRLFMMVLLCMPVSTATAERSFSKMRRVKTYLRNTMTTERLSGLRLLNIYQDREIHTKQVVDVFARRKERRLALIFKV